MQSVAEDLLVNVEEKQFFASLSTLFDKSADVFPTPSPGPPRLVKAPAARHPLPRGREGRGLDDSIPALRWSHNPCPRNEGG
jgi:hypothetical protein